MSAAIIDGYAITITHPEKILFPQSGITKRDILSYYLLVAPYMVPLCKNHPVAMHRYVHTINDVGFFQKAVPDFFPEWIARVKINKRQGGSIIQLLINNTATLIFLANQDCITPHIWLSKVPKIEFPDRLIFDLDPCGNASFEMVVNIAYAIRDLIADFNSISFCMTTGSRGLHVVVPLVAQHTFEQVVSFARYIAQLVVKKWGAIATLAMRKNDRGHKVFIDIQRNHFGQMAVAPYAVRALDGGPVAMPIAWDELNGTVTGAHYFTINMVEARLRDKNPWDMFTKSHNRLPVDFLKKSIRK